MRPASTVLIMQLSNSRHPIQFHYPIRFKFIGPIKLVLVLDLGKMQKIIQRARRTNTLPALFFVMST